jgi:predicted DNA-binding transcriptional regulator YafY
MQVAEQVRAGQHERIAWLHDKLSSGARIIPQDVSAQFGVSLATAGRDFDYLQYIAKAPVAFDYGAGGFHYTSSSYSLPERRLTEGELAGLLVLGQLERAYSGASFQPVLAAAADALQGSLREYVTIDEESLDQILQVEIEPFPRVDIGVFQSLLQAIRDRESIVVRYFSGQKATVIDKPCDPYHLLNFKDNWYLVCFCHEKQDYRDFLCSRILGVEHTNTTFLPDPDFSLEAHKRESQLFASDAPSVEVVAEFDKYAAHWIRLREVHPSQTVVERGDGSLEISFRVSSLENIIRWILSFGEHARILAPLELQDRVRRTIGKMNYLYNRF